MSIFCVHYNIHLEVSFQKCRELIEHPADGKENRLQQCQAIIPAASGLTLSCQRTLSAQRQTMFTLIKQWKSLTSH